MNEREIMAVVWLISATHMIHESLQLRRGGHLKEHEPEEGAPECGGAAAPPSALVEAMFSCRHERRPRRLGPPATVVPRDSRGGPAGGGRGGVRK